MIEQRRDLSITGIEPGTVPASLAGLPAGFVSRLLALSIDLILLTMTLLLGGTVWTALVSTVPVQLLGAVLIRVVPDLKPWLVFLGWLIPLMFGIGIVCNYFLFFFTSTGQTIGKRLMGLRVVSASGGRLSFGRATLRLAGYVLSALPMYLGFFAMLTDDRRRAWHDRIAGSVVIYAWDARPGGRYLGRAIVRLRR